MSQKELTKKEKQKAYKANKFYDNHMAGKYNPEIGEYNLYLSKSKSTKIGNINSKSFTCFCGNSVYISETTSGLICSNCGKFNKVG